MALNPLAARLRGQKIKWEIRLAAAMAMDNPIEIAQATNQLMQIHFRQEDLDLKQRRYLRAAEIAYRQTQAKTGLELRRWSVRPLTPNGLQVEAIPPMGLAPSYEVKNNFAIFKLRRQDGEFNIMRFGRE